MDGILRFTPAVFAVEDSYQIFVPVSSPSVMWIEISGECYYHHSNGVLISDTPLHKITVPMCELDRAGKYTVCYRRMIERKPYFSETGDVERIDFIFRPLPEGRFTAFQIADAHGMADAPVAAAEYFKKNYGGIDLLILNGDVINHSGSLEYFDIFFELSERITHGSVPVIFSRGNHDTRGIYAERIADYSPTRNGESYFTFRLGTLWGIVLDCGEDKPDTHEEYGNTNCCHAFRRYESAYLKSVARSGEYLDPGIKHRLIIAHNPFTKKYSHPFNIEEELFADWISVLNSEIKPDMLLAGHLHRLMTVRPGEENDAYGQTFPTVVGSLPDLKAGTFAGCGLVFKDGEIEVIFCDSEKTLGKEVFKK
jgi:predicted phosphodiesterase